MELRRARPDDVETLTTLLTQFFAGEGFSTPPETIAARVPEFLGQPGNAAFLAVDGEEVVGVSTVTSTFGVERGHSAEIEDLYVVPSHRGRGIATSLLGEAMMWSTQEGFETLEVVVTPDDPARRESLIRWYGRLGFRKTSRQVLLFNGGA
ncbi:MAG TPA: GNAT family N-acetyltransferase [Acidimicrobiia bacterium]|jgi:ribosomal protein S18 acetylase RimI-like enzyme|nr:GNAT family N-acetyltransferase [Acidimicrobiia bacterium]